MIVADQLPEFEIRPAFINLINMEPQKALTKEIRVISNYGEDFEIVSVSSRDGNIKLIEKEKVQNGWKLNLEIIPPSVNKLSTIFDMIYIDVKDKDKLTVACTSLK